jgi:hypothetical protein
MVQAMEKQQEQARAEADRQAELAEQVARERAAQQSLAEEEARKRADEEYRDEEARMAEEQRARGDNVDTVV